MSLCFQFQAELSHQMQIILLLQTMQIILLFDAT